MSSRQAGALFLSLLFMLASCASVMVGGTFGATSGLLCSAIASALLLALMLAVAR